MIKYHKPTILIVYNLTITIKKMAIIYNLTRYYKKKHNFNGFWKTIQRFKTDWNKIVAAFCKY